MIQVMGTVHVSNSIILDDLFDFKHVTRLFCNDCGGKCFNEVLLLF